MGAENAPEQVYRYIAAFTGAAQPRFGGTAAFDIEKHLAIGFDKQVSDHNLAIDPVDHDIDCSAETEADFAIDIDPRSAATAGVDEHKGCRRSAIRIGDADRTIIGVEQNRTAETGAATRPVNAACGRADKRRTKVDNTVVGRIDGNIAAERIAAANIVKCRFKGPGIDVER